MKPLLPFTLFCCFCLSSMYAVQEQDTSVTTKNLKIDKVIVKEATIKTARSSKHSVLTPKITQPKALRKLHGVIGHSIIRIRHREIIDRRKRIAGNN